MALESTATQALEDSVKTILSVFDNPKREGLLDTPARVARMYHEFFARSDFNFTTFDADGYDEMIVESNIGFYSLCEHHMLPFVGTVAIGYVPDKKIVGLSKLARTVEHFARRLQVQERMTMQIADFLIEKLNPKGVGVILRARHFCMEMRGVRKENVETVTSSLKGVFIEQPETRAEFMMISNGGRR